MTHEIRLAIVGVVVTWRHSRRATGLLSTGMDVASAGRKRPTWCVELPLLIAGYVAFGLARGRIVRGEQLATSNALCVQRVEQVLRLSVEHPLNRAILAHPSAIYLTGYFYRLCLITLPVILVWLYVCWPGHYRYLRTVLVVMTLLDLPLVWLFPVSPPRFAQNGIVDHVGTYEFLGGGALRDPSAGLNLFAAMPSTHIAWTSWCAYAAWSVLRRHSPRWAWSAWLYPLLVAVDVLTTGNHYELDILCGVAVLALAIGLTTSIVYLTGSSGGADNSTTPSAGPEPPGHGDTIDRNDSQSW